MGKKRKEKEEKWKIISMEEAINRTLNNEDDIYAVDISEGLLHSLCDLTLFEIKRTDGFYIMKDEGEHNE